MDLSDYLNNHATTYENEMEKGALTISGSSFPANEISFGNKVYIDDIPFRFNNTQFYDNLVMDDQKIFFNTARVKRAYFLGCSNNGDFFESITFFKDNKEKVKTIISLSDFLAPSPRYSDKFAFSLSCIHTVRGKNTDFRPNIWYDVINFETPIEINNFHLEYNPFIHIFSITLLLDNERRNQNEV